MAVTTSPIEVFVGPMFAGKTTHLLRLHHATLARVDMRHERVLVIKYAKDTRYSTHAVSTHDHVDGDGSNSKHLNVPAIAVHHLAECERVMDSTKCYYLFVDEGQFFDDLESTLVHWHAVGHTIAVAALDYDSERRPWEQVSALLTHTNIVKPTRLRSRCAYCQRVGCAEFTRRIDKPTTVPFVRSTLPSSDLPTTTDRICIGGSETYQPCCEQCWPWSETSSLLSPIVIATTTTTTTGQSSAVVVVTEPCAV